MPAEKTIAQIYKEHEQAFSKHLGRAKHLKEQEVHKLRVEIKNLNVLFDFLKTLSDKKFKTGPQLKLLKPVFKKAGKIRTCQLNTILVQGQRSAIMQRFKNHLSKEEEKAGRALVKEIQKFDETQFKKLHKKNLKAFSKLKPGTIRDESEIYIRNIFAKLRIDIFDIYRDEALHEIRKNLKTIRNIGRLLLEIDPKQALNDEIKKIHGSYEKIGDWHDGIVLADEFEKYVLKKENSSSLEKASALLLKLMEKNERNKLLIAKKLREDLV